MESKKNENDDDNNDEVNENNNNYDNNNNNSNNNKYSNNNNNNNNNNSDHINHRIDWPSYSQGARKHAGLSSWDDTQPDTPESGHTETEQNKQSEMIK